MKWNNGTDCDCPLCDDTEPTVKFKSKKYWIAVDEKGGIDESNEGVPILWNTKKDVKEFGWSDKVVRATLTWNIEEKKK